MFGRNEHKEGIKNIRKTIGELRRLIERHDIRFFNLIDENLPVYLNEEYSEVAESISLQRMQRLLQDAVFLTYYEESNLGKGSYLRKALLSIINPDSIYRILLDGEVALVEVKVPDLEGEYISYYLKFRRVRRIGKMVIGKKIDWILVNIYGLFKNSDLFVNKTISKYLHDSLEKVASKIKEKMEKEKKELDEKEKEEVEDKKE